MAKVLFAAATLAQLTSFATATLGLDVQDSPKPTKDGVRALILSTGFEGEEIEYVDAPAAAGVPLTVADAEGRKMVRINIPVQENVAGGNDAVPVGCNGTYVRIMRGIDVDVPVEYVHVLKNAEKMVYDRDENMRLINPRLVPIYPFSVVAVF